MLNLWHRITAPLSKCGQMATRPALAQMNPMLELILHPKRVRRSFIETIKEIIILNPYIVIEESSTNERLIERAITYRDKWLKDGFL